MKRRKKDNKVRVRFNVNSLTKMSKGSREELLGSSQEAIRNSQHDLRHVFERPLTREEKTYLLHADRGDYATVKKIIDQYTASPEVFDINCVDPLNRSALIAAIENENIELIKLLLDSGIKAKTTAMTTGYRNLMVVTAMCLMMGAAANPARRSQDIEARRRSAVDRSLIRFGRSYPAEPSAADIREMFQRPTRRGTSFLRLGRSQPLTLNADDLISLLRTYEDYEEPAKRGTTFMRLGRSPQFMRLGRSDAEKPSFESGGLPYPERKGRARNQFLRLGRDSEELNEVDDEDDESRNKRAVGACQECEA